MQIQKEKFTIALAKEDVSWEDWRDDLAADTALLEVVWSEVCTPEEAWKEFKSIVMKQSHEFHQLKTITKWRMVRIYNGLGELIGQES